MSHRDTLTMLDDMVFGDQIALRLMRSYDDGREYVALHTWPRLFLLSLSQGQMAQEVAEQANALLRMADGGVETDNDNGGT